jgi:thiamine-monophosphate kinase
MSASDRSGAMPLSARLIDIGERRIIDEVIRARLLRGRYRNDRIGDDAGIFEPDLKPGEINLISTDPCPTPVVFELLDQDYWHYGRMTAVIGLSDIAAMGGRPHGLVVSTLMHPSMCVSDYIRFLDGLCEACDEWETPVLGGNIRESHDFQVTCTVVGSVERTRLLERSGARPGDRICVIGTMGAFWAGVLSITHLGGDIDSLDDRLRQALLRPRPRLREGALLAASRLVTACMDASDGVGGCLATLGFVNNAKVILDSSLLSPPTAVADVAEALSINPLNLMLSWGNWELVFTADPRNMPELRHYLDSQGVTFQEIGRLANGSDVWLEEAETVRPLTYFGSDRFTNESYMTMGVMNYADWLIRSPLVRPR